MNLLDELRDVEADAIGQVRIAEAMVKKAQQNPGDEVGLVSAQEALAKAKRDLARRSRALLQAEADAADSSAADDALPPVEEAGQELRPLCYESVDSWVEGWLQPFWRRRQGRWCRQWWAHAEALSRLSALWQTWELTRWESGRDMAIFYRDYVDRTMYELTAQNGTFEKCDWRKHQHEPLPGFESDLMPLRIRMLLRQAEDVQQPKGS